MHAATWTTLSHFIADERVLPPDFTPSGVDEPCGAQHAGYVCSRRPNHTARHAAGNERYIVAVWPEPSQTARRIGTRQRIFFLRPDGVICVTTGQGVPIDLVYPGDPSRSHSPG